MASTAYSRMNVARVTTTALSRSVNAQRQWRNAALWTATNALTWQHGVSGVARLYKRRNRGNIIDASVCTIYSFLRSNVKQWRSSSSRSWQAYIGGAIFMWASVSAANKRQPHRSELSAWRSASPLIRHQRVS